MELTTEDAFAQDLAAVPSAPAFHAPTFGDDVGRFVEDLGKPGFGHTGATVRASFESGAINDSSTGTGAAWQIKRQYEPLIEAINQGRPWSERVSNPYFAGLNPRDYAQAGMFAGRDAFEDYVWGQAEIARQQNPAAFANLPRNKAELLDDARREERAALDYARQLQATGGPITGTVAGFVGGMAGSMADPANILVSVSGFPASESLLKKALIEGTGNVTMEVAGLPGRMQHYADIGTPMSPEDVAAELASSFVFGAGIGGLGHAVQRVLGLKGHALADEFRAANPDASPTLRTAAAMVEDEANRAATNPFADTPEGRDQHRRALLETQGAMDQGEALPEFEPVLSRLEPNDSEVSAALDTVSYARGKMADEPGLFHEMRSLGGIAVRDEAGNMLRGGDEVLALLKDRKVPGLINNKSGRSPDYMREALREKGWFGAREDNGADIQDLYDLIDQEARGSKVYHPDSQVRAERQSRAALDEELGRAGVTAGDSDQAAAEKLARWRLHSSEAEGSALSFWRQQADAAGVEYRATDLPEDLMAAVFEAEAVRAERDGTLGLFADDAEALLRQHIERLYPDVKDGDLEREFQDYAQREAAGGHEGEGGQGPFAEDGARAGGDDPGAGSYREGQAASHAQHKRGLDPEELKRFTDPLKKPDAFTQQAEDLAREVAPALVPSAKQPPIVAYRQQFAAIEKRMAPPAEGMTRLWRGNRPGEVGQNPQFTNDAPGIALPFQKAYGGDLSYVDVPTADLDKYLNNTGGAPGAEFIVPAEIAAKAKVAPEAVSPFGAAGPLIEALDRLDGGTAFADPVTGQQSTLKAVTAELKREARAVERLRGCVEGDK